MGKFIGTLADGTVAAAKGAIYTVPLSSSAKVSWLSLHNATGGNEVVILYIRRRGTSRRFHQVTVDSSGGSARIVDELEQLPLSGGDSIEAQSSNAGAVEYVVGGEQISADSSTIDGLVRSLGG